MLNQEEFAGKHLSFRTFLECSDSWQTNPVNNVPKQEATFVAIQNFCREVLDPVWEEFGPLTLTYGFSSPELSRIIRKGISPKLDQHAGHELNRSGNPICPRLGFAADFYVPKHSSLAISKWIVRNTNFDRLYFYGASRPLHVSVGPEQLKQVVILETYGAHQRRVPRRIKQSEFLDLDDE